MLYQCTLNIPAGTLETAPVSAVLEFVSGTSTKREVIFHDGCNGNVHVRVNDAGWQLMPWNRDAWLHADGETVVDESPYPVQGPHFEFTLYGYNADTVNDHEVILRVTMMEGAEHPGLAKLISALRGYA